MAHTDVLTPPVGAFVISQGDSLPIMRIPVPANAAGQLIDLSGCTVTFLGRKDGTTTFPSPIIRPIESYASEQHDFGAGLVDVVAVYVHLTQDDTRAVAVASGQVYQRMQGELEVLDAGGETLTVGSTTDPEYPYIDWYIRDDIGEAV